MRAFISSIFYFARSLFRVVGSVKAASEKEMRFPKSGGSDSQSRGAPANRARSQGSLKRVTSIG
jgi:hypothetical protein